MARRFREQPQIVDPVETHINRFFGDLIVCLNQRRFELLDTVRDTRKDIAARPAARLREQEELLAARTEVEQQIQMNELRETQLEILAKLDEKLVEIRREQPETRVLFRGNSEDLEQLIRDVGEVLERSLPVVPHYHVRPIVAVGKQGQAPGKLYYHKGVAVDSRNNQIYITEGENDFARVSIFTETGEFLKVFSHELMTYPCGIAISGDNIYVTDCREHFVLHFKMLTDILLIVRVGGRGSGCRRFNEPRQITISNNGEVFVADRVNDRIQILDFDLNYRGQISHNTLSRPCDVKLEINYVCVLTEAGHYCVHIFSNDGRKICSRITRSGIGMQVVHPISLCIDDKRNIIISDNHAHQIKVFSSGGTFLNAIGGKGSELGMLYYPQGIALINNSKLVVVSHNPNYGLQIFSCD